MRLNVNFQWQEVLNSKFLNIQEIARKYSVVVKC